MAGPDTQVPEAHTSFWVQVLPSLQDVPLATTGFEQVPFAGLQVPAVWHWSTATHVTAAPGRHTPAVHESLCVQALPSLQDVPLATTGFEQVPFAGLQVPAV
jgi:hypothetical protein